MEATKVGIREFRENLSTYLESKTPVAITRHGATIGIYLPTPTETEPGGFGSSSRRWREAGMQSSRRQIQAKKN